MDDWKTTFPLGARPIFRCYVVSLREWYQITKTHSNQSAWGGTCPSKSWNSCCKKLSNQPGTSWVKRPHIQRPTDLSNATPFKLPNPTASLVVSKLLHLKVSKSYCWKKFCTTWDGAKTLYKWDIYHINWCEVCTSFHYFMALLSYASK